MTFWKFFKRKEGCKIILQTDIRKKFVRVLEHCTHPQIYARSIRYTP